MPDRESVGLPLGEGLRVEHWLALGLSVPDCVCVAHCEGCGLPLGLPLGDWLGVPEAEGVGESGNT